MESSSPSDFVVHRASLRKLIARSTTTKAAVATRITTKKVFTTDLHTDSSTHLLIVESKREREREGKGKNPPTAIAVSLTVVCP